MLRYADRLARSDPEKEGSNICYILSLVTIVTSIITGKSVASVRVCHFSEHLVALDAKDGVTQVPSGGLDYASLPPCPSKIYHYQNQ